MVTVAVEHVSGSVEVMDDEVLKYSATRLEFDFDTEALEAMTGRR